VSRRAVENYLKAETTPASISTSFWAKFFEKSKEERKEIRRIRIMKKKKIFKPSFSAPVRYSIRVTKNKMKNKKIGMKVK
jgi:hypothetical protein